MKAILLTVLVMLSACSVFEPREPEDPDPNPPVVWQTPTQPSIVISNLQNSLNGLSLGYYNSCFHDDFVFTADPLDVSDPGFQGLDFSNWTKDVESQTVSSIIYQAQASGAPSDSLSQAYFNTDAQHPDPSVHYDSVTIYHHYYIVAAGTLGCGWDRAAMGSAWITLVADEFGLWSIRDWDDIRVPYYTGDHYTWGVAKALYRR